LVPYQKNLRLHWCHKLVTSLWLPDSTTASYQEVTTTAPFKIAKLHKL